ncbi:MAG: hypothetical protein ACLP3R_24840 [Candidatus Korobacteraceae bacterium]
MPVQLTHIGEDLIAEILDSLAKRQELSRVKCAISDRPLADDIEAGGLGESIGFRADDATLVVQNGALSYACDGEQKVDVLCSGGDRAIAFEAKLGETRMGSADFRKRFCVRCEKSKHADSRLSGSMVAVLERLLPFDGTSNLVAQVENSQWTLVEPWWLVVRQVVVDKWRSDIPVASGRILVFDALARIYGSRLQFDQLVKRVVGSDFASRWSIPLNDP